MKRKNKFFFIGYNFIENNNDTNNYTLLFSTDEAVSFYEALKQFQKYMSKTNHKFMLTKILDGPPESEIPEHFYNYTRKPS